MGRWTELEIVGCSTNVREGMGWMETGWMDFRVCSLWQLTAYVGYSYSYSHRWRCFIYMLHMIYFRWQA